jgi:hypothetical protein
MYSPRDIQWWTLMNVFGIASRNHRSAPLDSSREGRHPVRGCIIRSSELPS